MHDVKFRRSLTVTVPGLSPCMHVARGHNVIRKGRCCFFLFFLFLFCLFFVQPPDSLASLNPLFRLDG